MRRTFVALAVLASMLVASPSQAAVGRVSPTSGFRGHDLVEWQRIYEWRLGSNEVFRDGCGSVVDGVLFVECPCGQHNGDDSVDHGNGRNEERSVRRDAVAEDRDEEPHQRRSDADRDEDEEAELEPRRASDQQYQRVAEEEQDLRADHDDEHNDGDATRRAGAARRVRSWGQIAPKRGRY